ncbi:hypothetical protein CJF30_00004410 [Rutstroemia sp. NJR-2017a BBW]|nr:hypothetical protein CJF30_00004410 [Rutstroemia sp. NJR-2017a BBW]
MSRRFPAAAKPLAAAAATLPSAAVLRANVLVTLAPSRRPRRFLARRRLLANAVEMIPIVLVLRLIQLPLLIRRRSSPSSLKSSKVEMRVFESLRVCVAASRCLFCGWARIGGVVY